jgi:hexosaminidase
VAELGWSPKTHADRTLASFQARMASQGARWQAKGQNFYPSTQIPWRIDVAAADKRLDQGVVDGELATIAAPGATLAQLTATVDWGDGASSPATLTGTAATNKTANGLYSVSGSHTYPRPGGYAAKVTVTRGTATSSAAFDVVLDAVAQGAAGGTVPATLALSLGAPASFGPFTPGVAATYTTTQAATVISTAGDAALTVADPSTSSPGRLVNGAFALPQPLLAAGQPLPATVKTWAAPTSNEAVAVEFKQPIGAGDALRTGSYSKTLVFTLSTTTP